MDGIYIRECYEDPYTDSQFSGHVNAHLNVCCDIDAPCEGVDVEDYVLGDMGEYVFHPFDGVCATKVEIDEDGNVEVDNDYLGENIFVFEGRKVDFYVYDGVFVQPTTILGGPFASEDEAKEFVRSLTSYNFVS